MGVKQGMKIGMFWDFQFGKVGIHYVNVIILYSLHFDVSGTYSFEARTTGIDSWTRDFGVWFII